MRSGAVSRGIETLREGPDACRVYARLGGRVKSHGVPPLHIRGQGDSGEDVTPVTVTYFVWRAL